MRWNKDVACSTYSANFSLIWSTVSLPPPAPARFLPSGTHFHLICNANSFAPLQSCIMHNYSLHTSNRSGSSTSGFIALLQVGILVICTWTLSYCIGGVHIYSVCNPYCSLPALSYYPHINQCAHCLKDMWTRYLPILCSTRVYFHPNVRACVCVSVLQDLKEEDSSDCNGFGFPT